MAFVADTRMIANCWKRPGNSSSANNLQEFLANSLHRLGEKRVYLLRADSGFSDSAFLDHLDGQPMHHFIALRQTQPLQRALVSAESWWVLHDEHGTPVEGIELARFSRINRRPGPSHAGWSGFGRTAHSAPSPTARG